MLGQKREAMIIMLLLQVGYRFELPLGFFIEPRITFGLGVKILTQDIDGVPAPGLEEYTTMAGLSPSIGAAVDFGWRIDRYWFIRATFEYSLLIEEADASIGFDGLVHTFGIAVGDDEP